MLRAFGHVAMCCGMLGVVGSSLKMVKFEPTTPSMLQHVATGWPNVCNILHPTMVRFVALTCCGRLAGLRIPNKSVFSLDYFNTTYACIKSQNIVGSSEIKVVTFFGDVPENLL